MQWWEEIPMPRLLRKLLYSLEDIHSEEQGEQDNKLTGLDRSRIILRKPGFVGDE